MAYGQNVFFGSGASPLTFVAFDVSGIGVSNNDGAIVQRLPLPFAVTIFTLAAVCAAGSGTVNVVYGENTASYVPPAFGGIAVPGSTLFAVDIPLLAPGGVAFATCAAPALWPAGTSLTLRATTPAGNGVSGLKVVLGVAI